MKYAIVIISCSIWLLIFKISGCELLDSPFGFVSGCKNHGVNWNSFLAPSGFILLIIMPMALIHLLMTVIGVLISYIKFIIKKQKT